MDLYIFPFNINEDRSLLFVIKDKIYHDKCYTGSIIYYSRVKISGIRLYKYISIPQYFNEEVFCYATSTYGCELPCMSLLWYLTVCRYLSPEVRELCIGHEI